MEASVRTPIRFATSMITAYRTRDLLDMLDVVARPEARLHASQLNRLVRAGALAPSVADSGRGGQRRWDFHDVVLLRCVGLEQDAGAISADRARRMSAAFDGARGGALHGRALIGDRISSLWRVAELAPGTRSAACLVFDLGWIADELEQAASSIGLPSPMLLPAST